MSLRISSSKNAVDASSNMMLPNGRIRLHPFDDRGVKVLFNSSLSESLRLCFMGWRYKELVYENGKEQRMCWMSIGSLEHHASVRGSHHLQSVVDALIASSKVSEFIHRVLEIAAEDNTPLSHADQRRYGSVEIVESLVPRASSAGAAGY